MNSELGSESSESKSESLESSELKSESSDSESLESESNILFFKIKSLNQKVCSLLC